MNILKTFIIACISALRPLLGPQGACKYELSCSDYAHMQLKERNILKAFILIIARVLSCNPITRFSIKSNRN